MAYDSRGDRDSKHPIDDAEAQVGADAEVSADAEAAAHAEAGRVAPDAEPMRVPPLLDDEDPTPPPPRPTMSDQTKPPVLKPIPTPRPIKIARTLWIVSFALGGAAIFIAFLSAETLIAELTVVLGRLSPGYDADAVASLVNGIFWGNLGGLGLIIAIEAILLAVLLNRRGGARWAQLPVLVVHTGALLAASAFLAIGDWGGLVELLLVAGLVVAFAGWVLCLFPQANRWLRMKDQAQLAALD